LIYVAKLVIKNDFANYWSKKSLALRWRVAFMHGFAPFCVKTRNCWLKSFRNFKIISTFASHYNFTAFTTAGQLCKIKKLDIKK